MEYSALFIRCIPLILMRRWNAPERRRGIELQREFVQGDCFTRLDSHQLFRASAGEAGLHTIYSWVQFCRQLRGTMGHLAVAAVEDQQFRDFIRCDHLEGTFYDAHTHYHAHIRYLTTLL